MEKYVDFQLGRPISHHYCSPAERVKRFHGAGVRQKCPPVTQERALVRQELVNMHGQGQGTGKKRGGWGRGMGESRCGGLSLLSPVIHFSTFPPPPP